MHVFVTGGAGYIGSICVEQLLDARHSVTVFDNLTEGHRAMFATYPDYKMVVYPSARNAFFPDAILKATVANATRASLAGTDDVQGAAPAAATWLIGP